MNTLKHRMVSDEPISLKQAVERFAKCGGLHKVQTDEHIEKALNNTREFNARVNTLQTRPDENKERFYS